MKPDVPSDSGDECCENREVSDFVMAQVALSDEEYKGDKDPGF
jgi:hypothetical protein